MNRASRRDFLQGAGLLAGAVVLSSCDQGQATKTSGGGGTLRWWDQFQPTSDYERSLFAEFGKDEGATVDYTVYNPEKQGQALQLAWSSKQMPDVFTLAGVLGTPASLHTQGWFAPLQIDDEHRKLLPEDRLFEGKHIFDGKLYSFPWGSFMSDALTWFNTELLTKADLDPASPPATYDEFRAAARKVAQAGGDGVSGWIHPIKLTGRMASHLNSFAEAAGSPTVDGVDLRTGEHAYHNEYYVEALEWWLAMQRDGLLFPGSNTLDARAARARWATGTAGFFFDGPYNIGVLSRGMKAFTDKVGVGSIVVPQAGSRIVQNSLPQAGTFWISAQSRDVELAGRLVQRFAEPDVQVKLAEGMNNPPMRPESLERANVHPTFETAAKLCAEQIFQVPDPVVRNADVAKVYAETKPVRPELGEIVQGAFAGDLEDWRGALRKLSADSGRERDRALTAARKKGAKVAADAFAFPDWQPARHYTANDY